MTAERRGLEIAGSFTNTARYQTLQGGNMDFETRLDFCLCHFSADLVR